MVRFFQSYGESRLLFPWAASTRAVLVAFERLPIGFVIDIIWTERTPNKETYLFISAIEWIKFQAMQFLLALLLFDGVISCSMSPLLLCISLHECCRWMRSSRGLVSMRMYLLKLFASYITAQNSSEVCEIACDKYDELMHTQKPS